MFDCVRLIHCGKIDLHSGSGGRLFRLIKIINEYFKIPIEVYAPSYELKAILELIKNKVEVYPLSKIMKITELYETFDTKLMEIIRTLRLIKNFSLQNYVSLISDNRENILNFYRIAHPFYNSLFVDGDVLLRKMIWKSKCSNVMEWQDLISITSFESRGCLQTKDIFTRALFSIMLSHERSLASKADKIVVTYLSQTAKNYIKKRLFKITEKIPIYSIPNAPTLKELTNLEQEGSKLYTNNVLLNEIKEKSEQKITLCYIGGLQPRIRGIEVVLKAIDKMYRKNKQKLLKLFFIFIGNGPLRREIYKFALKRKIEDNILLSGSLPRPLTIKILKTCNFALLTYPTKHITTFFALPTKLFEYMYFSKPVIMPRCMFEAKRVVQEGGIYYSEDNGLYNILLSLDENFDFYQEKARNGRKRFITKYAFENYTHVIKEIFH